MLKEIINQGPAQNDPQAAPPEQAAPQASADSGKNLLSSDVEIKGTLKFANHLMIDGRVEGEILSEGDLLVGANANLRADIKTRSVTVFGKIHGSITATDRCELKQNAELHGDVTAGKLAIEEGAIFMGTSTVGAAARGGSKGKDASSGKG